MDITGHNLVGYKKRRKGQIKFRTFDAANCATNEVEHFEANDEEIDEAVSLARKCADEYANLPGTIRAKFLNAIADEMLDLGDALLEIYCKESSLPRARAEGERARTINQLKSFAALLEEGSWLGATIDTAIPDRSPIPKPDLRKMNFALGPIVVFGSSNFPFAYSTAGGDTASALAAGCPVIVKSHPMHAGTSEMVATAVVIAAQKINLPEGVFSNLNSRGIDVGKKLVLHEHVKGVGFTGSIQGGRALMDLAASRKEPIPVFAEMGSVNAVVVLPKAAEHEAAQWAKSLALSITQGSGQFCTKPGMILTLAGSNTDQFCSLLVEEIMKITPSTMLHPAINENFKKGLSHMLVQDGVSILAKYDEEVKDYVGKQTILKVDGKNFRANQNLHNEVFGPYSLVVACTDIKEMKEIIENLEGQLTGTILSFENELAQYGDILQCLKNKVGRLILNGVPTGVEVCPSMHHGGPYPSSSDNRFTAVGIHAIYRWLRPVCYQSFPNEFLPDGLKNENPLNIVRLVNGLHSRERIL